MGLENLSRVSQEGTDGETRGDRSVIPTDSFLSPADVDVELLPILRGASVKVAVTPPSLRRPRPSVCISSSASPVHRRVGAVHIAAHE